MGQPQPLLRGIGRDVAWSYVPPFVNGAASLLIAGYALRRAGTVDYGLFVVVTSVTALITLLGYTMRTSVVRATARQAASDQLADVSEGRADVAAAHSALVAMAVLVALASVPLAYALPIITRVPASREAAAFTCMVLVGAAAAVDLATTVLPAAALGTRDFRLVALCMLAGMGARAVLVLLLVPSLKVVALGLALLVSMLVERLLLLMYVRRKVGWLSLHPVKPGAEARRRSLSFALPLLALSVNTQIVASSDSIVIGTVVGAAGAAIYAVGARIPRQVSELLTQVATAVFPTFSGAALEEEKLLLMRFMTRVVSYGGGVAFAVIAIFRGDLVQLVLGRTSRPAETVLLLFSLTFAVDLCLLEIVLVLVARGRHAVMAKLVPFELVTNLVMTVVLVRRMGVPGAAVAGLVTFLAMDLVIFPTVARHELKGGVLRPIVVDGLIPASLGACLALLASAGCRLVLEDPWAQLVAGAVMSGLVALGAGLFALGADGRASLRLAMQRRETLPL